MINAKYVDGLELRIRELSKKLSDEADAALQLIAENKSLKAERDALSATVEALRDALAELRDVAQRCDSWESFPQNALDAADAALHETPHYAEIKIPTGAEAASGMALIGMSWLENNAPEKLTELHREIRAQAGRDGFIEGVEWQLYNYNEPTNKIDAADKYADCIRKETK